MRGWCGSLGIMFAIKKVSFLFPERRFHKRQLDFSSLAVHHPCLRGARVVFYIQSTIGEQLTILENKCSGDCLDELRWS